MLWGGPQGYALKITRERCNCPGVSMKGLTLSRKGAYDPFQWITNPESHLSQANEAASPVSEACVLQCKMC